VSVHRPMPVADADSAPFWDGCRARELRAQRCAACGRWRWPPAAFCPQCRTRGGTWTPVRGTGAVSSFVVVHRATHPAFAGAVPYAVVLVSLDEAPDDLLLLSNLIECEPERVRVGMRVAVAFDVTVEDLPLPLFRPESA